MIKIIDHILTDEECDEFIALHTKGPTTLWYCRPGLMLEENQMPDKLLYITSHILQWSEVVMIPTGLRHDLHLDTANKYTTLSAITYLNDDFEGGELFFEDGTIIKPIKGRTVIFEGSKIRHGVKEVTKGVRYSLPAWYS